MIELRLLGPIELVTSTRHECRAVLAQPKRLGLLAYLAAAPLGGFHRRDRLVALFWPELDADHARNALNQAVRHLRRSLGAEVVSNRGAEELEVNRAVLWCDVVEFREASRTKDFARADALYRGDLLAGFFAGAGTDFEDWLELERSALRREAAESASFLARRHEREQRLTEAVSFARRAAALADTDERMIRELIGLLDRIGDRAGAVDAYASFTKRLSRELDVAPSAETQLLLDQVRSRDCADPSVNDVDAHELPPQRTVVVGERRAVRQRLRHLTIPLIATAIAGTLLAKSLAPWMNAKDARATAMPIQSLAILPLRNITGDRQQDYFAEGLTAALGSAIGQIHSIRVVSAASSQRYLDTSGQPKQIATRLGADALLEGTVRLSAGRVTVTIDLVDGRTDRRLWTQNYERDLADIMMLFADAARGVAAEMLATLDSVSLSRPRRLEPGAAAAYLKGEYFRKRWMEGGCFPAERYFQEAIRIDSTFAEAYAGLSSCYVHPDRLRRPASEVHRQARMALKASLDLDSTIAAAHYNLGLVQQRLEYDWEGAAISFRRAITLDPSSADAQRVYGEYLYLTGLPEEGIAMMRASIELDPFQLDNRVALGFGLRNVGKYDEAARELEKTLHIDPDYSTARLWLAESFASNERHDDAVREYVGWLRQVLIAPRLSLTDSLTRIYRRSGWSAFWRAELGLAREEILHPGSVWRPFYGQYCGPYYMARRYARLGDHEHALIALEEAYRLRRHLMVFVQVEPLFILLRGDARFVQLTRQIHLPQTAAVAR